MPTYRIERRTERRLVHYVDIPAESAHAAVGFAMDGPSNWIKESRNDVDKNYLVRDELPAESTQPVLSLEEVDDLYLAASAAVQLWFGKVKKAKKEGCYQQASGNRKVMDRYVALRTILYNLSFDLAEGSE